MEESDSGHKKKRVGGPASPLCREERGRGKKDGWRWFRFVNKREPWIGLRIVPWIFTLLLFVYCELLTLVYSTLLSTVV